jgi:hypothetical protein
MRREDATVKGASHEGGISSLPEQRTVQTSSARMVSTASLMARKPKELRIQIVGRDAAFHSI